jgi:tRNA uridine 5-carboxymethylaminomethyl modification enzyme
VDDKIKRINAWLDYLESHRDHGVLFGDQVRRGGEASAFPDSFLKESIEVRDQVLYRISYKGYIDREERQIERLGHIEQVRIPSGLDFMTVRGLRRESALKLAAFKPYTLGQASRISGINPTDISLLQILIEAGRGQSATDEGSGPNSP